MSEQIKPFAPEAITRLSRDLRKAGATLTDQEARYMVDAYYTMQDYRKASDNQARSMGDAEPHELLDWWGAQCTNMETDVSKALDIWSTAFPAGRWMRTVHGIGPVLAANFLAHLDVTKTATAGGFWRFAGLDPSSKWEKKTRRPWNAKLKVACWKLGESWVKLGTREDAFYAQLYRQRKEFEVQRNESGGNAERAARIVAEGKIGKDTVTHKANAAGKLSDGHINDMAKRWAVKIFLAHLHHVMYVEHYGTEPPKPYAIDILGHGHMIGPWNYPIAGAPTTAGATNEHQ